MLLQLARDLFEDTTNLEIMMKKVMMESMELIPSERCSVMLIDQEKDEVCVCIHIMHMCVRAYIPQFGKFLLLKLFCTSTCSYVQKFKY